jgi:hypothetical protein
VRLALLALALAVSLPVYAQDKEAPKKKKAVATKKAHQQASKDQIRKFDDLQKKQPK